MHSRKPLYYTAFLLMVLLGIAWAEEDPTGDGKDRETMRAALEEFNSLIGGWRGAGLPRRGSNRGAWSETAQWVWQLKSGPPALLYEIKNGKLLESARLTYLPDKKTYQLNAKLADGSQRQYQGQLEKEKLILVSPAEKEGAQHRLSITRLNEKRTLVLFESRRNTRTRYRRVAEVGYTRAGTKLAQEGGGQPECIVTGGKGTSTVVYKGKTYYLCCSGCREAFEEDPEGIIAEAAARAKRKKSSPKTAPASP